MRINDRKSIEEKSQLVTKTRKEPSTEPGRGKPRGREDRTLKQSAQAYRALGDETRLRILALLKDGELCVCDVMAVLDLPQSTASRHLATLRHAGWVIGTRRGRWMYYRLDTVLLDHGIQQQVLAHLETLHQIKEDAKALGKHLVSKQDTTCF
jgi:ArsR family transcriptional regulator, arsenate/arsenite/antimonite-responsive transcriptional repressor